jgi:hypothetical protein
MRIQHPIAPIKRRAVGANDFGIPAHVEEDVRMIERGERTDTHELVRTNLDDRDAGLIMKVGDDPLGHV